MIIIIYSVLDDAAGGNVCHLDPLHAVCRRVSINTLDIGRQTFVFKGISHSNAFVLFTAGQHAPSQ